MKLNNIKTFEEHTTELSIPDTIVSFVRNKFYTKHYKNGGKIIFEYRGKSNDKDMVDVYMFCNEDGEEYQEYTEVYVGKAGTSNGSYIEMSTQEDIDFLKSIYEKNN